MNRCHVPSRLRIQEKLGQALETLLDASHYAADTNSPRWDFAVSMDCLRGLGANETDLRWLVRKGYVEHQREVTVDGDDGRAFRKTGDLTFVERSCFVLTRSGVSYVTMQVDSNGRTQRDPVHTCRAESQGSTVGLDRCSAAGPHWDSENRKLRVDGILVKSFKWQAVNQEAVLCAFQEEGWPERIDDPLPPHVDQDSKRRLADTIKCLNRKQITELVHFRGDGTGEGVTWERLDGRH